jgi:hypothetical protein
MLRERGILPAWVSSVMVAPESTEPDRLDPALLHVLGRISAHGNRVLRVVIDPATTPVRVITVFFDRKAFKVNP